MDGFAAVELCPLPLEIVEPILSLLPVPVLCRFRTVCKVWNRLISKPAFGALCNAGQDARFIVVREKKGYSFLDMSERRWYTIKRCGQEVFRSIWRTGSVAVDGGLVFEYSFNTEGATVFVSNLIAKTFRRLPSLPGDAKEAAQYPLVNTVVDNITHSYKIFVMPRRGVERTLILVYESTTDQWRSISVPRRFPWGSVLGSVFFHGLLYVLMPPSEAAAAQDCLWSYNHVEDVWRNTHVNLHTRPLHENFIQRPQLVVSDGRLFLASRIRPEAYNELDCPRFRSWSRAGWSYEVSEVHLGGELAGLSRVFEMPEAVMSQLRSVHLKAIGCCNCIVFMCYSRSSGISTVYDLRTSSWDLIPANPVTPFHPRRSDQFLWHGSQAMNLILPQWSIETK